ncbi:MAG: hypothetical protein LH473_01165 [Chitinophagales bacterium]|nr:hypothetical protein [Chitinophagales bacterium]
MKNLRIAILILFFFNSCRHEKKITPEVYFSGDSAEIIISNSKDQIYKGLFVVGKNILSFRDCNRPEKDLAVIDSTGKMKELYKTLFLHSPAFPYEYVYVELKGEVKEATDFAPARIVDSVIVVSDVLDFEQKNYQNACIPYDFWALGKNWSLQISRKEGIIAMKDFSAMRVYVFEYFIPKMIGDKVFNYTSNNYATQSAIKVLIKHESCMMDSSNHQFNYSATVIVDGKRYSGCAIKGTSTE